MSGLTLPAPGKQTKPFYSEAAMSIALPENPTPIDVAQYKSSLKEQQYQDFEAAIHDTAQNVSNFIKSPDAIHFSRTSSNTIMDNFNAAPKEKKTAANLILIKSLTRDERSAAINRPDGDITVASPHFLDEHTEKGTLEVIKALSNDDLLSEDAKQAAAFVTAHETGHGISEMAKHAAFNTEVAWTLNHFAADNKSYIDEIKSKGTDIFNKYLKDNNFDEDKYINEKLVTEQSVELEKEILADSFGILKTQQEYYKSNREAIEDGDKPLVTPMLDRLFSMRSQYAGIDNGHDTSDEIAILIDKLSSKEANEQLLNASDEQLIVTAYDLMAKTFQYEFNQINNKTLKELVGDATIQNEAKLSFPDAYLKGHDQPLFDFKLNKDYIDKNTQETRQRIQEDNEPGILSKFGL